MKSKKAGIGIGFVGIVAFVVIIITLILGSLFLIGSCSTEKAKEIKIKSATGDTDMNLFLITLLKSPLPLSKIDTTFADVGTIFIYDTTYNDLLNKNFNSIFQDLPNNYAMTIKKGDVERKLGNKTILDDLDSAKKASIAMPSPDKTIITFTLYRI